MASINSGSNANCYYIGTMEEGILVDAGLSNRETIKRLGSLGLDIKNVKAIFISHEHSDHVKGVKTISKKHQVPIYITKKTLHSTRIDPYNPNIVHFQSFEPVVIGDFEIIGFPKFHDAVDPHSFVISYKGIKIGVITDIGMACENVACFFGQCQGVFLEANYDDVLLENGNYPVYLKNRVKSDVGHLSNAQAYELFQNHRSSTLQHLVLSHISKDNNTPRHAISLFEHDDCTRINIIVASRYEPTPLLKIS